MLEVHLGWAQVELGGRSEAGFVGHQRLIAGSTGAERGR